MELEIGIKIENVELESGNDNGIGKWNWKMELESGIEAESRLRYSIKLNATRHDVCSIHNAVFISLQIDQYPSALE